MLRVIGLVLGFVALLLLGGVQLASYAAYGDLAVRPSLPAVLHDADPHLLRPMIGGTFARAAAAVHNGEFADADLLVHELRENRASADLRGRLKQARDVPADGPLTDAATTHVADAIAAYVRAGDAVRAQQLIDRIAQTDPGDALRDERDLVNGLANDGAASEDTGQTWWRLGQLQAAQGYRDARARASLWRDAEASYERALALAPNEETYLLAAGFQSLANGDVAGSSRWYVHAAEVVPNSADAYAGLAWTAAARGDCAAARAALARSRALRGDTVDVPDPTANQLVGAPLHRCAR